MLPQLSISPTRTTPLLPLFITAADIGATATVDAREGMTIMATVATVVTIAVIAMIMATNNYPG